MASIFTIERRKDFPKAFTTFFEDLQTKISTTAGVEYTMYSYLDHCIRYWPHRCGATGINDYLKSIDVDIKNPKEDKDLLLTLELIINLLHWAPRQDGIDDKNTEMSFPLGRGNKMIAIATKKKRKKNGNRGKSAIKKTNGLHI